MMRHTLYILISLLAMTAFAQSRMPELKLTPKYKTPTKETPDTSGYEERPYFLLIGQSEKALAEADYDAAARRLVEAMAIEPHNPLNVALLSNLGMIYFYEGRDTLALATLDEAARRAPKLIAAHSGRAKVLGAMHRDDEARAAWTRVIDLDSLNTDARYYRGLMALYANDLATAEADIAVLASVVPAATSTAVAQATLYGMTGRERQAVTLWRHVIDSGASGRQAEYYAAMAGCQLALDDLAAAAQSIADGLALPGNDDDAELYYWRAVLNHRRYLHDDAMADARRAIQAGADRQRVAAIFKQK